MKKVCTLGMGVALAIAVGVANPANAAPVLIGTTIVPGASSSGVSQVLGSISDSDTLSFSVSGTPYLQNGPSYGVNAAGVVTYYGQVSNTAVGDSLVDTPEGLGFTYGALIATLNGVSKQVFATNATNGLGSSAPPMTLAFSGTIASLFGANVAAASNTLTFRVDDDGYSDNSGFFTVTGNSAPIAAVPEPASWVMMIAGFGMLGFAFRRRTAKVSYAA